MLAVSSLPSRIAGCDHCKTDETMNSSNQNERLAMRFVDLLAEKAVRNGRPISRWGNMSPPWQRAFLETVPAFLEELGYRVDEGWVDDRREDEQIRVRCENLTQRQRLKTYRQLYALGCRIDGIEHSIGKLTSRG
jgi:hypothetical protein